MSVGVWTLVVFSMAAIPAAGLHALLDPMHSAALIGLAGVADAVAALAGLVLATYTGVLLGATVIPVWSAHVRLLPFHFAASSLGAAVSLIELVGHRTPALNLAGIGAAAIETTIGAAIELRRRAVSAPLVEGGSGRLTRIGGVLSGPAPLVLRLAGAGSFGLRTAAALCAIAGSIATRFGWIAAGRRSVVDPRAAVTLALVAALVVTPAAQSSPVRSKLSVTAVVSAASAYVADYQKEFAFLIADEDYKQENFDRSQRRTGARTMHGELFLTFVPADREWIAVHDVAEVDGAPVPDREDLRALIQKGQLAPVAQRLADRNARFNIGMVARNFNEPTFGLLVLEAKHVSNFTFTIAQVEPDAGPDPHTTLVTLAFSEHSRPTLVKGPQGKAVFAKGEIVVEAETGRVRKTFVQFQEGPIVAELTTTFIPDPKLGLWVPVEFAERYAMKQGRAAEETRCRAEYSNYRRFEVRVRIK